MTLPESSVHRWATKDRNPEAGHCSGVGDLLHRRLLSTPRQRWGGDQALPLAAQSPHRQTTIRARTAEYRLDEAVLDAPRIFARDWRAAASPPGRRFRRPFTSAGRSRRFSRGRRLPRPVFRSALPQSPRGEVACVSRSGPHAATRRASASTPVQSLAASPARSVRRIQSAVMQPL